MDKLNRWLTLLANLGVLVGIVFLIYEINQNTQMMETQINQSRAELSMLEAEAIYNSDYIPEILTKVKRGEPISDEESERYSHFLRGLHRNWDNQLRQYREGFLSRNIPRSVRQAILVEIASVEAARLNWEQRKQAFSDEYIAFVDSVLAEPSH